MSIAIESFVKAKLASKRKESTLKNYRVVLEDLNRFAGKWPLTAWDIREFFLYKGETVNRTTLNTLFKHLAAFFNWCEREGILPEGNPMVNVDEPRRPKHLPKALSREQVANFITVIEEHAVAGDELAVRDLALFRLAYDTGCRATELGNILLDDLDMEFYSVFIRLGKGDKDRYVYFGENCHQALQGWLDNHPGGEWLFPSRLRVKFEPLTRKGVRYSVKRWAKLVDVEMTTHQLRHTYATHALRNGIDLGHVSNQLGHSDIATTAIYLSIDSDDRRRAHREKAPGDSIGGAL